MTPRFVSWAAVSSLPQAEKISLEDQLKTNKEHVERHGGELVAELTVPGESRNIILFEDARRRIEAYQQLHDLIQARGFDVLIYLDRGRLGRKASLSMAIVALCEEAGILPYEIENPPQTLQRQNGSYDDQLLGAIKSVGYQQEVVKLTQRHRSGMIGRVKEGKMYARIPYGYRKVFDQEGEEHYEVVEEEAEVLRWLFRTYIKEGLSFIDLCDRLNDDDVPRPDGGRPWGPSTVGLIFRRAQRYAGWTEANKNGDTDRPYVKARGDWKPIIPQELADAVDAERQERAAGPRRSREHKYARCCACAHCDGKMMYVHYHKARERSYYYCQPPEHRPETKHNNIPQYRIDAALLAELERLAALSNLDSVLADTSDPSPALVAKLEKARADQTGHQEERNRLTRAYVTLGVLSDAEYQAQMQDLRERQERAQERIGELEEQIDKVETRAQRRHRLEDAIEHGAAIIQNEEPLVVNQWAKRRVRIWVADHQVVRIEWL